MRIPTVCPVHLYDFVAERTKLSSEAVGAPERTREDNKRAAGARTADPGSRTRDLVIGAALLSQPTPPPITITSTSNRQDTTTRTNNRGQTLASETAL